VSFTIQVIPTPRPLGECIALNASFDRDLNDIVPLRIDFSYTDKRTL
jgi:hypothetical protein